MCPQAAVVLENRVPSRVRCLQGWKQPRGHFWIAGDGFTKEGISCFYHKLEFYPKWMEMEQVRIRLCLKI